MRSETVIRHGAEGFAGMHKAGRLAAKVLDMITPHVIAGASTEHLDRLCHDYILAHGATPAPLNYKGFPKSTCISLNHVVCHGIPGPKTLRDGDILNIDITVILDSWYGDTSRMFYVGEPSIKAKRLTEVTYDCLMRGIGRRVPVTHLAILVMQSNPMPNPAAFPWFVTLPAMVLDRCFTPPLQFCIMAKPAVVWFLNRGWFSPSSQ